MSTSSIQENVTLAPYTTLGVGGKARYFKEVNSTDELIQLLEHASDYESIYILGYGNNTLISDSGLSGLTLCVRGGNIQCDGTQLIADAGVWWDDVVIASIDKGLWGIELMSQIPGSVGAATYINITAYGQSIGPRIVWVDVWDTQTGEQRRIAASELDWSYKTSLFQQPDSSSLVILRVCLQLEETQTDELTYQSALDVAAELELDPNTLADRRKIIVEARMRAGSILNTTQADTARTVGSFFRNPLVTDEQAEQVMSFDETGKTRGQIELMNQVHGGDKKRVSAAHVMLAAGFSRGETWRNVKLNDKNLLKIEALPGAQAQDIYNVMTHVQQTCQDKLGIELKPEAQLLGDFAQR